MSPKVSLGSLNEPVSTRRKSDPLFQRFVDDCSVDLFYLTFYYNVKRHKDARNSESRPRKPCYFLDNGLRFFELLGIFQYFIFYIW